MRTILYWNVTLIYLRRILIAFNSTEAADLCNVLKQFGAFNAIWFVLKLLRCHFRETFFGAERIFSHKKYVWTQGNTNYMVAAIKGFHAFLRTVTNTSMQKKLERIIYTIIASLKKVFSLWDFIPFNLHVFRVLKQWHAVIKR